MTRKCNRNSQNTKGVAKTDNSGGGLIVQEFGHYYCRKLELWQSQEESAVSEAGSHACGLQSVVILHVSMVSVRDHGLPNVYKGKVFLLVWVNRKVVLPTQTPMQGKV